MQASPTTNSIREFRALRSRRASGAMVPTIHPGPAAKTRPTFWSYAPLTVMALGSLFVAPLAGLRPHDSQRLAAIFPPWWTAAQSLVAASQVADVGGFGAFSFIVAVRGTRPGLATELRNAGALLVVDGALFTYCGTPPKGA